MAKKNSKLYSNGVVEKYFSNEDVIPEEFKEIKIIYINDGVNNKRWFSNKEIPEGFVVGKLPLSRNWDESKHKHHSEETKKKISDSRKLQGSPWSKGFKHSEETKQHLSEIKKGKPSWNKGIVLTEEQKEKVHNSLINHFGSLENFYDYKNNLIKERYGCTNPKQLSVKNYSEELFKLYLDRDLAIKFLSSQKRTRDELSEYFHCPVYVIDYWSIKLNLRDYINHPPRSHYEEEIMKLFPDVNWEQHDRKILNGKEIDLYSEKYKLRIEFNGTYWHSTLNLSDKKYHQTKSKLANEKGIHLIHVYEHEWNNEISKNILINIIKNCTIGLDNKIYARNCSVKKLPNLSIKSFVDLNHLQGHRNASIAYGLFYKDELIQIMSFSKNKKYEWEIIRECTKLNTQVIGGVSKLFSHFIQDYNPNEVFSYCDFNKFTGNSYKKLGMDFIGYTQPDLSFIIDGKVYKRNPTKNKEQQEISEAKIYGAGSKKFLWTTK